MTDLSNQSVGFVSLSAYGYFNPDRIVTGGGAERQLYLLSQHLQEHFDVHFVVGDYGQPRTEQRDGVTLHRAYHPDPNGSVSDRITQAWRLFDAMRRADADVFVHRGTARKAAITYAISRFLGRRWVYNLANDSNIDTEPDTLPLVLSQLFKRALRNADGIIAQTEYQKRQLQERFDASASIVPNGYSSTTNQLPYDDRSYVLWVGSADEEQKRPHLFLDLAESIPDIDFRLIATRADDDDYFDRVRRRATEMANVDFISHVPPDEIHTHYRTALTLVSTSAYEGFPNTFLEAWRQGTPVISLTVDPSRYVGVEESGFCDDSFSTLVNVIRDLSSDRDTWRRYAEPPMHYFEQNLTIEETSTAYADVLREALQL
jgi:glycosyltransferase involved in cell wall biosynthesis